MAEQYKAVYKGGEGEITEKKSRFIATIAPVETHEQAIAFIETIKKKYWDARHNCFAYCIGLNNEIQRCSDDGEPSQTAGKPMLDVLLGEEIHNACVVVTRYFGGTLLGTGGLVRAYSGAVKAGLNNCTIIEKRYGIKLNIGTDYNGIGKLQYLLGQRGITVIDTEYSDKVLIKALVPEVLLSEVKSEITEAASGQAALEEEGNVYYAVVGKEVVIFD